MLASWRSGTAVFCTKRFSCSSFSSSSSSTTSERSLRMYRAPFISSSPPMMALGTPRKITVPRIPMASVRKPDTRPPMKPPMKKMYRVDMAVPMPRSRYGTTAWSTGPTIANADAVNTACGIFKIQNQVELCTLNCSGVSSADGRISSSDQRERACGVLPVPLVEVAADQRQHRQGEDAREAEDDPAFEHAPHVQVVVEVQRFERGLAEQAEPEGTETDEDGADRRGCA